jgi:uncharacterized protein involved in tellurium resistance
LGKVTVTIIDGFEFIAVDGDDRLGEKVEGAAKLHIVGRHYEWPCRCFAKVSG